MRSKDTVVAALLGLFSALVWIPVLDRVVGTSARKELWLFIAIPLLYVMGLFIGVLLSRWKHVFHRLAKFGMIGVLNSGIDFGIFNLFIYSTGIEKGPELAFFKSVAFVAALLNSYFWNKYWTFDAAGTENRRKEFFTFAAVTVVGFALNVGITSLLANAFAAPFGLSQLAWDNLAAALATGANLLWNFVGYHFVVFRHTRHVNHALQVEPHA